MVRETHPTAELSRLKWVAGGGCQQHMDVVGHQHIGMDRHAARPRRSPQRVEIDVTVLITEKAGGAVNTALDHVDRNLRKEDPGSSRHEINPCRLALVQVTIDKKTWFVPYFPSLFPAIPFPYVPNRRT